MDRRFDASPGSVSQSRRFAEEATSDLPPEIRDSIVLMVSELATNALVHASSGFDVRIERDAAAVRAVVTDSGGGSPSLTFPEDSDPHGRGLRVVQELSDEWGTTVDQEAGRKSVWFIVDVSGARGADGERAFGSLSRMKD